MPVTVLCAYEPCSKAFQAIPANVRNGKAKHCTSACRWNAKRAERTDEERLVAKRQSKRKSAQTYQQQKKVYDKQWTKNNPEKISAKTKRYRKRHPARVKTARARSYKKHKTKENVDSRRYAATHLELFRGYNKARRARRKGAYLNDLTHAQWLEVQAAQNHRCYYCGKRYKGHLTQDHITPLSKGGSHTLHNVIAACQSCNSSKRSGPAPRVVQPFLLTVAPAKKRKVS